MSATNVIHLERLGNSLQRVAGRGSAPVSLGDTLAAAIRRIRILQEAAIAAGDTALALKADCCAAMLDS